MMRLIAFINHESPIKSLSLRRNGTNRLLVLFLNDFSQVTSGQAGAASSATAR